MGSRTEVKSLEVGLWVVEQYNLVVSGPVGSPVVGLCVIEQKYYTLSKSKTDPG